MLQQPKQNLPTPVFVLMLFCMTVGLGSRWDCHVQVRPGYGCVAQAPQNNPSQAPPPDAGCVNSQPTYTSGPRLRGEFTVIVQEFPPRLHSAAYEYSAALRRRRINNYIFQR